MFISKEEYNKWITDLNSLRQKHGLGTLSIPNVNAATVVTSNQIGSIVNGLTDTANRAPHIPDQTVSVGDYSVNAYIKQAIVNNISNKLTEFNQYCGSSYNGSGYNGSGYNGSGYNGSSYNGSGYNGSSYDGNYDGYSYDGNYHPCSHCGGYNSGDVYPSGTWCSSVHYSHGSNGSVYHGGIG